MASPPGAPCPPKCSPPGSPCCISFMCLSSLRKPGSQKRLCRSMLVVPVLMATVVILVDHRVSPAPRYEVAVHRKGRHERHRERDGEAAPEEEGERTGLHRPGDHEH